MDQSLDQSRVLCQVPFAWSALNIDIDQSLDEGVRSVPSIWLASEHAPPPDQAEAFLLFYKEVPDGNQED
jgi:hypothetical protein